MVKWSAKTQNQSEFKCPEYLCHSEKVIWPVTDLCSSDVFNFHPSKLHVDSSLLHNTCCLHRFGNRDSCVAVWERNWLHWTSEQSGCVCLEDGDRNQNLSLIPLKPFLFFFYTAICGNSTNGNNLLTSQVTLVNIELKPDTFCSAQNVSKSLNWLVTSQILSLQLQSPVM